MKTIKKEWVKYLEILENIDGDLVIVNGAPYSMDGKKIEIA